MYLLRALAMAVPLFTTWVLATDTYCDFYPGPGGCGSQIGPDYDINNPGCFTLSEVAQFVGCGGDSDGAATLTAYSAPGCNDADEMWSVCRSKANIDCSTTWDGNPGNSPAIGTAQTFKVTRPDSC